MRCISKTLERKIHNLGNINKKREFYSDRVYFICGGEVEKHSTQRESK